MSSRFLPTALMLTSSLLLSGCDLGKESSKETPSEAAEAPIADTPEEDSTDSPEGTDQPEEMATPEEDATPAEEEDTAADSGSVADEDKAPAEEKTQMPMELKKPEMPAESTKETITQPHTLAPSAPGSPDNKGATADPSHSDATL